MVQLEGMGRIEGDGAEKVAELRMEDFGVESTEDGVRGLERAESVEVERAEGVERVGSLLFRGSVSPDSSNTAAHPWTGVNTFSSSCSGMIGLTDSSVISSSVIPTPYATDGTTCVRDPANCDPSGGDVVPHPVWPSDEARVAGVVSAASAAPFGHPGSDPTLALVDAGVAEGEPPPQGGAPVGEEDKALFAVVGDACLIVDLDAAADRGGGSSGAEAMRQDSEGGSRPANGGSDGVPKGPPGGLVDPADGGERLGRSPDCRLAADGDCTLAVTGRGDAAEVEEEEDDEHCNGQEFPCTVDCCHSVYSSMRKLQVHMMAHTYGRPYRCTWDDCGWSFTSSYKLKRHFVSHEKQRPFVCEEADCGKRFSTVYNLKAHRRAHGAGVTGAPACLLCGAAFATPARLAAHQRVHAEPRRPHLCDFPGCEKTFSTANALGAHRRSHARARELFVCSYPGCGKTYDKACRLTLHLRSHTGERPFTCEHEGCGWTFTCMSKLLRHKRKHADERRFACREPGCGKTFTRAEHLKGHTITHSGTRPFTCDVQGCGARFSARSSLYVHSRKHGAGGDGEGGEGLRSQCPVATCGKLFASVHSVKAHMMKLHNVSPAQFALLEQSGCLVPACDPDDDPSGGSVDPKLLTSDLSSSCLTATSDPLSGGGSPPSYGDDVLTVDGTAIGGGARGRLCRTSPQDTKRGGAGGSGSPAGQGLAQGGAAPAERRRQHQQQHGVEDQGLIPAVSSSPSSGAAAATASTETTGVICPGLLGSLCMKLESTATLGAELPSPPPSFAGAETGTVLAAGGHDTCAMRQSSVALSHTPLSLEMLPSSLPPAACAEAQALGLLTPLGGGGEQAKALAPAFCGLGSLSPGEVDVALASVQALLESGGSARTDYRSVQLAKHRKRKIGAAPYSTGASGKKKSKSSRAVTAGVTGAYSSALALQDPGSTGAHYLQVQILQDEAGGEGDLSFGLGSQGPHSSHSTDLPVHILQEQASCAAGEEVGDFGLIHPGSSQFPGSTINLQDLE
ncbi:zinc finger protein ZXDC-like [Lethenteron reissneri]|uniref:zinc finger protein ZXDC-like n=1 Tax=Lethenteron reissneri TaxID=7753 RepID=UPI002AB727AF|nr:zinc finger protein ZXDC-like [Lethenteron reissneri]